MKELAKWVQREAKGILFVYGLLDVYSVAKVNLRRNGSCTLLVDPGQGYDCRMMGFDRVTYSYLEDMLVSAHRDYRRLLRKGEQGEERWWTDWFWIFGGVEVMRLPDIKISLLCRAREGDFVRWCYLSIGNVFQSCSCFLYCSCLLSWSGRLWV